MLNIKIKFIFDIWLMINLKNKNNIKDNKKFKKKFFK